MKRFQTILCPTDFSEASDLATAYARAWAVRVDARLHLVHVAALLLPAAKRLVNIEAAEAEYDRQMREALDQRARAAREQGVRISTALLKGFADDELIREAEREGADLAIMATHGLRGFRRWVLGSTTESLLRHLPIPLLTLSPPSAPAGGTLAISHILLTTDFSAGTRLAAEQAFELARIFSARVTLLHTVEPPEEGPSAVRDGEEAETLAQQWLAELVPKLGGTKSRVALRVLRGVPYREILGFARAEAADLLVMNIHGKGFLERAILGATAERVIRDAPCPVLAVPPILSARPASP